MKKLLVATLIATAGLAQAEPTAAKKALIDKVLQLYQPQMNLAVLQLGQRPIAQMEQQITPAIQFRVPSEKREALIKDIQAEVKKYNDEVNPALVERVKKFAPSTVGVILDEKFSEDELKQLIAAMENPVVHKFGQLGPEIGKSLIEKVGPDAKSVVEPRIAAMQKAVTAKITAAIDSGQSAPGAAPAKPANK